MLAIEMVSDRAKMTPDAETTASVFEACREAGLILSKSGPHRSTLGWCRRSPVDGDVDTSPRGLDRAFDMARGADARAGEETLR